MRPCGRGARRMPSCWRVGTPIRIAHPRGRVVARGPDPHARSCPRLGCILPRCLAGPCQPRRADQGADLRGGAGAAKWCAASLARPGNAERYRLEPASGGAPCQRARPPGLDHRPLDAHGCTGSCRPTGVTAPAGMRALPFRRRTPRSGVASARSQNAASLVSALELHGMRIEREANEQSCGDDMCADHQQQVGY
jgi:hypothetical protein